MNFWQNLIEKILFLNRQFYLLKGIHCNTGYDLSMHIIFANLTIFSSNKEQCIFFFKWELCLLPEACCTLIKSHNIEIFFQLFGSCCFRRFRSSTSGVGTRTTSTARSPWSWWKVRVPTWAVRSRSTRRPYWAIDRSSTFRTTSTKR